MLFGSFTSRIAVVMPRLAVALALLLAGIATGAGAMAVVADETTDPNVIHGCVNNQTGALRIVATCRAGETPISWNMQGVPGPQGNPGVITAQACTVGEYMTGVDTSGAIICAQAEIDGDGDGFVPSVDCDDTNAAIHPSATEINNDRDDNCDGQIDEGIVDADNDGHEVPADCNDDDPTVYPGASEFITKDNKDNDCDGSVDEGWADIDGDGYYTVGTATSPADCNDYNAAVHPGARETFNQLDDDCDGVADEGLDADGDGYGVWSAGGTDCDDSDATVYPWAEEVADGRDNDCDGVIDEGFGG